MLVKLDILSYRIVSMIYKMIKQTLNTALVALVFAFGMTIVMGLLQPTMASDAGSNGVKCSILPKSICDSAKNKAKDGDVTNTGVFKLLIFILNILTAGVGIVAVGAVVYAGILYSSAGDNASQVQQAKDMIKNTIIGIVAFAFMYLLLNWLIPGGIFS